MSDFFWFSDDQKGAVRAAVPTNTHGMNRVDDPRRDGSESIQIYIETQLATTLQPGDAASSTTTSEKQAIHQVQVDFSNESNLQIKIGKLVSPITGSTSITRKFYA